MTQQESAVRESAATGIAARNSAASILASATALISVAFAIGIVVAGQALTTRNEDEHLGRLAPLVRWLHVRAVYGDHPRSVVAAGLLLLLGGVLFAIATRRWRDEPSVFDGSAPVRTATSWTSRTTLFALTLVALGTIVAAYVNIRLLTGNYSSWLVWFFALSIAAIGRGIQLGPWRPGKNVSMSPAWWEVALVAIALTFFLVVNVRDLDSWRYAAIGDEYAFYGYAKGIEKGILHANFFSQFGVWDQRPVGTSAMQAASMAVFGVDNFGWRMASVLVVAATIPAVYLIARELFDRSAAIFATLVFTTSHYLIAYAHTTYDNIYAILPFTWCIALAVVGLRRASPTWLYAAGIAGGLGFYTFPTARMAPIVLLLFLVTLGPKAWKPSLLAPLAIGFLVAGLPLFATDKLDAISVSQGRTVFGFTPDHEAAGIRILQNIPRSSLVWSYSPDAGHFVSGSFLDPLAAIFLVLGLAYGFARMRNQGFRLLAIWLGIIVVFAGLFSPYPRSPYDRLHLALPVVSIYAGFIISALVRHASANFTPTWKHAGVGAAVGVFVVLAPILAWLNLYRFLVDSPKVVPTSDVRLILGGLRSDACYTGPTSLAIMPEPAPLLVPTLETYPDLSGVGVRRLADATQASDYSQFNCIVVSRTRGQPPTDAAYPLISRLESQFGFQQTALVNSKYLGTEAVVLTQRH